MIKRNEIDIAPADALQPATMAEFDLEAYFERIGYAGERTFFMFNTAPGRSI